MTKGLELDGNRAAPIRYTCDMATQRAAANKIRVIFGTLESAKGAAALVAGGVGV